MSNGRVSIGKLHPLRDCLQGRVIHIWCSPLSVDTLRVLREYHNLPLVACEVLLLSHLSNFNNSSTCTPAASLFTYSGPYLVPHLTITIVTESHVPSTYHSSFTSKALCIYLRVCIAVDRLRLFKCAIKCFPYPTPTQSNRLLLASTTPTGHSAWLCGGVPDHSTKILM